jgi:hypothetical protein
MVHLHDVVPAQVRVTIALADGEQEVDVRGLTFQDISDLIARFPDVLSSLKDGFDASVILKMGPVVVAAVMAYGCGAANDTKVEAILSQLPLGTQVEILTAIMNQTAPKGAGPFVKLLKLAGLDLSTVRSAMTSAQASPAPLDTSSSKDTDSPT